MQSRTRLVAAILALALSACGLGNQSAPSAEARKSENAASQETDPTTLELRVSPLVELYFYVRAQAADVDIEPAPGYEAAVAAARAIQETLGSFGGWGPLDSQVFTAADAGELLRGFAELPEPYERRGRTISIRDDAVRLATALQEVESGFVKVL